MPYKTMSDLPKAQVLKYTLHQKKAFLEAFNNAYKEYGNDEGKAFAVAHHAAQQASGETKNLSVNNPDLSKGDNSCGQMQERKI